MLHALVPVQAYMHTRIVHNCAYFTSCDCLDLCVCECLALGQGAWKSGEPPPESATQDEPHAASADLGVEVLEATHDGVQYDSEETLCEDPLTYSRRYICWDVTMHLDPHIEPSFCLCGRHYSQRCFVTLLYQS
jgi:hypothetical protein